MTIKKSMKKIIYVAGLLLLSFFVISNIAIRLYGSTIAEPNADTVIILGAQVIGDPARPTQTLQERLDVAVIYLQQNLNSRVIVCGGQGHDEAETEASVMKDYLVKQGIGAERILLEDKSTRTVEQFIYANKMVQLGKTVVVTSDFHLLRSVMLAKRAGIEDVSGLPAPLHADNRDRWVALWREPLALVNTFLFDHP